MSSRSPITARYAETDRMGIIHHSVYPIWYEVARLRQNPGHHLLEAGGNGSHDASRLPFLQIFKRRLLRR